MTQLGHVLKRSGVATYDASESIMVAVGYGDSGTGGSFCVKRRCIIRR